MKHNFYSSSKLATSGGFTKNQHCLGSLNSAGRKHEKATYGNDWILSPRPNPRARLRLFCFPYAGGGASAFCNWPVGLPSEIELCAVQLPGRENRFNEPAFTQISQLLHELVHNLQPFLDQPFAFFGHSMGSLINFELARQLRRDLLPSPVYLFVSGGRAPHLLNSEPPSYQLSDSEFINRMCIYNGIPEVVFQDADLIQLLLPKLRADVELLETYIYTKDEPLGCPISAFGGVSDPTVSQYDLSAWREQTSSIFNLCMLPGDHFFLQSARNQLLQNISLDLIRILEDL